MIDAFARHSSGSDGWSEVGRLEIRAGRDFAHFGAQRIEHQISRRAKYSPNVRNLKALAFHLQMANHRDCRETEFRAAVGHDLQRHRILSLGGVDYVSTKTRQPFVSDRGRVDRSRQIVRIGDVEIRSGQLAKERLWTTSVRRVRNGAECAPGQPCAAAFISRDWSPTTRAETLPPRVDATADRSRSGDHDEAGRAVSGAIQSDVCVSYNVDIANAEGSECFTHALAQLPPPRAGQSDLRRDEIVAPEFRRSARTIDRLAHRGRRPGNTDAQRIRWTSKTFANHPLIGIHDHRFGLGAPAVDTHHGVRRVQASGWGEICCASVCAHIRGSVGPENTRMNIFDHSRRQ